MGKGDERRITARMDEIWKMKRAHVLKAGFYPKMPIRVQEVTDLISFAVNEAKFMKTKLEVIVA